MEGKSVKLALSVEDDYFCSIKGKSETGIVG